MAEYTFTGTTPRLMFGLSQAVNAWHRPADGNPSQLAEGQTVVLHPGDGVRIDGDYEHAELEPAPDFEPSEDQPAPPADPAPRTRRTRTSPTTKL